MTNIINEINRHKLHIDLDGLDRWIKEIDDELGILEGCVEKEICKVNPRLWMISSWKIDIILKRTTKCLLLGVPPTDDITRI